MPSNDTIRKINTNNGATGKCYLTNANTIIVGTDTYEIGNGFDFANVTPEVQEAAKYKKQFEIDDEIPLVQIDGTITLIETFDEAHRYTYTLPHTYIGWDETNHSISLPKRLVEWVYLNNGVETPLPSVLTQSFSEQFDNGNLNAYANWSDDVKAVRIIVFATHSSSLTPYCNVEIDSTSYSGTNPLTPNYSKMLHRKSSESESIDWAKFKGEIGMNTLDGYLGNGCQIFDAMYDDIVPCYYGVKSGDTIEVTLSGLNGKRGNEIFQNAYKPYQGIAISPQYKSANLLSAYFDEDIHGYQNYTQFSNGVYKITKENVTTDMTLFLPIVLNTYSITVKCEDSVTPSTQSNKGYVDILSVNYFDGASDFPLTVSCVNNETVTISVNVKNGYMFDHWEDGQGNTLPYNQSFNLSINANVANNIYVAHFVNGDYTLTYHKQIL